MLDINTPGGAIDVTIEMMDDLKKFPGRTIAFVDNEAMSAGAFISAVCDEIWFVDTPTEGIIGAAAPVQATGQDIDATMKEKLVSYLKVRMRAISKGKGYRGEVVSAMIDADMELKINGEEVKIDGKPIKEKGALLSLTATEAMFPVRNAPEAAPRLRARPGTSTTSSRSASARAAVSTELRGDLVRGAGGDPQPPGAGDAGARDLRALHRLQVPGVRRIHRGQASSC